MAPTGIDPVTFRFSVIVSPAMTAGNGIVIDKSAIASAVGTIQVAQSEDYLFANDAVALRATWRIGWNIVHPDRIGSFTISS